MNNYKFGIKLVEKMAFFCTDKIRLISDSEADMHVVAVSHGGKTVSIFIASSLEAHEFYGESGEKNIPEGYDYFVNFYSEKTSNSIEFDNVITFVKKSLKINVC